MKHTQTDSLFHFSLRGLSAISALATVHFCAPATAQVEPTQKVATATPTFEQWLIRADEIKVQDDASALYSAARVYAQQGEYDKAIVLWQKSLLIPAAPGANPPGMMLGPRDYRGLARWGIAESLRAQGKWSKSLAMYRLNHEKSLLDDGCVQMGAGFQSMVVGEGICLENLGRHDEAVQLYWPSAVYLYPLIAPVALRRLVDLYATSGQLPVLEEAVARQKQQITLEGRQTMLGDAQTPIDEPTQKWINERLSTSIVSTYPLVRDFRLAARAQNWPVLLSVLMPMTPDKESDLINTEPESADWTRREAIAALGSTAPAAIPILENALQNKPNNLRLQAALLYCREIAAGRTGLPTSPAATPDEAHKELQKIMQYELGPLQFVSAPINEKMPSKFSMEQ